MMLRNAAVAVALLTLTFTGSASAIDGIDLSKPATEPGAEETAPAADDCAPLTKLRYPFLCAAEGAGAEGARSLLQARPVNPNPSWESARQIPRMSDWTEGNGTWGPDLNQD
jgi:hypothetical protein